MEPCGQCGYSYGALGRAQIAPELRARAERFVELLGRTEVELLRAHRWADVWSALEYAGHVSDVHRVQGTRVRQACQEDQSDFAPMRREERVLEENDNVQDADVVAVEITAAAVALARTLDALDESGWQRTGIYHWPTTGLRTVDWIGRHTVHESVHHFSDMPRLLEERS